MSLEPGLYVTATPIGNLADMTFRAVEVMSSADLILCEDTRHTAKLCAAHSIKTPLRPYHDHNGAAVRPGIIERLVDGAVICLVSDAGTPLISDPGFKLVREAKDAGVSVFPIPGASALTAAMSVAGAPSDRFFFGGFPPPKSAARREFFLRLSRVDATLVFYETPTRLSDSLAAMSDVFAGRRAVVARELTKIHEEVVEGDLEELAQRFADGSARGEIVVVLHPPETAKADAEDIEGFLERALLSLSVKDAAAAAADALGISKKQAYETALALKKNT